MFFTHGHTYGVKYSDRELKNAARARGASLVIHGHTHIPKEDYDDGLYILCPGSVSRNQTGGSSYAVVEVGKAGILTNIIML
ncbi:MAG: metallophosphoesterase family protein [Oscillospiraceae bacterium]|nr:metallophosphoesterase family protein [Oscillospiraceae bacterium]